MTTSNTTQGAKLLQEAVKCAQRIREIIDEENFPKDLVWIPTIRAHSSVIHDNLTALEQPTFSASPSPVTEETKGEVPQWMCRAIEEIYTGISFRSFGLDPNSCKREAVQVLLRFALPIPSSSAPAQQGEITDALAEALEGFLGNGQIEVEIANARAALKAYRLAPPNAAPEGST